MRQDKTTQMEAIISGCKITLRQWNADKRITETSMSVASLNELFAFCVGASDPNLIERLTITGSDAKGRERILTFTFQSISDQS